MPREFKRSERVSGQMRRALSQLVQAEVKDPQLGFVSISDVEVTRDLAHATVYVTVFDPEEAALSLKALKRAAGFLRTRLSQELRMRTVPELHFKHDSSVETGMQMDSLIARARATDAPETSSVNDADDQDGTATDGQAQDDESGV